MMETENGGHYALTKEISSQPSLRADVDELNYVRMPVANCIAVSCFNGRHATDPDCAGNGRRLRLQNWSKS